jgi:hypothetical protein
MTPVVEMQTFDKGGICTSTPLHDTLVHGKMKLHQLRAHLQLLLSQVVAGLLSLRRDLVGE